MVNEPEPQKPADSEHRRLTASIALGTMIGLILGVLFDQFGVWLPIGMGVGTALGLALDRKGKQR